MTRWLSRGSGLFARSIAMFGLWMVFVDNVHEAELVTGGVVAVAAGILGTVVAAARRESARLSVGMLRYGYRPFVLMVTDTARVTGALLRKLTGRPVPGRLRAVRYTSVAEDPDGRARRILTEWAASVAPNRYAIGIEPDGRYLLIHELVDSSGPLDPLQLG